MVVVLREDHADVVLALHMGEGAVAVMHLTRHRAGQAVAHLGVGLYATFTQRRIHRSRKSLNACALGVFVTAHLLVDDGIVTRLTEPERQVFQLRLDVIESKSVSQGSIEIVRFAGYLQLLVGTLCLQGAHVMEPVGELDEQSPHICMYTLQNLTEIIDLLALVILLLGTFRNHVHKGAHIIAETAADITHGVRSILHHIMQQSRRHHVRVEFQVDAYNRRHRQRMQDIWFARLAALQAVRLTGKLKGSAYQLKIFCRETLRKPVMQFIPLFVHYPVVIFAHLSTCFSIQTQS